MLVYGAFLLLFGVEPTVPLVFFLMLGALLPDIDTPRSVIGQGTGGVLVVGRHRGIVHSVYGLFGFGVCVLLLEAVVRVTIPDVVSSYTAAFIIGYFSHLILDRRTPAGIDWWGG